MKRSILLIIFFTGKTFAAIATTVCPKVCPTGWQTLPNSGSDHCYLWPTTPMKLDTFWGWQSYCVSQQPTSYNVAPTTSAETAALAIGAISYLIPYLLGPSFVWIGAYYINGAFVYFDGTPYGKSPPTPLFGKAPANGSCIYWNPKDLTMLGAWSYRPCTDASGVTVCEMAPLTDCAAVITTPGPYTAPGCASPKTSDFVLQKQAGYMPVQELITLTGMTVSSCSVACVYHESCLSFDISTSGDCRLIGDNVLLQCSALDPDDNFQHYDKIFGL